MIQVSLRSILLGGGVMVVDDWEWDGEIAEHGGGPREILLWRLRGGLKLYVPERDPRVLGALELAAVSVCGLCRQRVPHHTNSATSIGGADRHPVRDLHAVEDAGGVGLAECGAGDIWAARDKWGVDESASVTSVVPVTAVTLYPCTVVRARYGGAYEGGDWLAFRRRPQNVPEAVDGGDMECASFFDSLEEPVGRGADPMQAVDDLARRVGVDSWN